MPTENLQSAQNLEDEVESGPLSQSILASNRNRTDLAQVEDKIEPEKSKTVEAEKEKESPIPERYLLL